MSAVASTSSATTGTGTAVGEISITARPILGLNYLKKRTRVDVLNLQVYVPPQTALESQHSNDIYDYKLDKIVPTESINDESSTLWDISEFNCINPEMIAMDTPNENSSSGYTPKIRLIEDKKYFKNMITKLNISKLEPMGNGIDYCKFKFILSELKLQYNNAKKWQELVHLALEIPKIESQKINFTEAQELLNSGISINNFVSLPLLPKLSDAISNCNEYIKEVDNFFINIDTNNNSLEMGNKLLQKGAALPFIVDQYTLLKNVWESHIDRTHQINTALYRNDYFNVAMLTQDDFKLNMPYIKQICNNAKNVLWLEQIKKMLSKTPKYIDAVRLLSVNLNNPELENNNYKLEMENRCIAAKEWLHNISKSSVSKLIIYGVREMVCDENYRKNNKHSKTDGDESIHYFTIFRDDEITFKSHLIDENNPFYNQDVLIQSLGGVESIINSKTDDNSDKPLPDELEKFYTLYNQIKLTLWCCRFLEPIVIKYRRFARRFKRAIEGGMSKIEVVILLQDTHVLGEHIQMNDQADQLKRIIDQAAEFESKCKQVLDIRRRTIAQVEAERLVEPWVSLDNYRKLDVISNADIENFLSNYKLIPGVDISLIDDVISMFDKQTIKNYPLMKELNDAKLIYNQWMDKLVQITNEPYLSNSDLNRTILLLLDVRKQGISFNTESLFKNLKCYIISNLLTEMIKTERGDVQYLLRLFDDLKGESSCINKLTSYLGQIDFVENLEATNRLKSCINMGIGRYLQVNNGMQTPVGSPGCNAL